MMGCDATKKRARALCGHAEATSAATSGSLAAQPAAQPFAPSCSSGLDRKIIATPVPPSPRQHRRRAETSIAFLAAPLSRGTAGPLSLDAISCLGAFRPPVARARG
jgi:hypothetical protein